MLFFTYATDQLMCSCASPCDLWGLSQEARLTCEHLARLCLNSTMLLIKCISYVACAPAYWDWRTVIDSCPPLSVPSFGRRHSQQNAHISLLKSTARSLKSMTPNAEYCNLMSELQICSLLLTCRINKLFTFHLLNADFFLSTSNSLNL